MSLLFQTSLITRLLDKLTINSFKKKYLLIIMFNNIKNIIIIIVNLYKTRYINYCNCVYVLYNKLPNT